MALRPLIRNRIPEMSLLLPLGLLAVAPPRVLLANLLGFEHEAFRLDYVEEELAHEIRRASVGLLEARAEPFSRQQGYKCPISQCVHR